MLYTCVYMYIYIYVFILMHIYIYVYLHIRTWTLWETTADSNVCLPNAKTLEDAAQLFLRGAIAHPAHDARCVRQLLLVISDL